MSVLTKTSFQELSITWPKLPEDYPLQDDFVEYLSQPLIAFALRQALNPFPEIVEDVLIVSNFVLCAAIDNRIICKAPDWMYVRPVQPGESSQPRRS